MRFLILVKASPRSEAGQRPDDLAASAMARFHETLARAGVLLDAAGLRPSREGWRVRLREGTRERIDGPFEEPPAGLVAGYTLIEVRSREEAMEWVRRYPSPCSRGSEIEIEVRPLYEPDEFLAVPASSRAGAALRDPGAAA